MITPAQFSLFRSTVNTMIGRAYSETPSHWERFADTIPCDSAQLVLGWTGMLPKARLWTGARVVNEHAPQTYIAIPEPYEATFGVDMFDLDDDKLGLYYRDLPDLGRQLKRLPDLWFRDWLENSGDMAAIPGVTNGLDGLPHFSTNHPVDLYNAAAGVYCNDFTGGGVTLNIGGVNVLVGGAFGVTSVATMREYTRTLKAEDGEAMGIIPREIMIPSLLELEAEVVLKALFFAPPAWGGISAQVGAADNVMRRFNLEPFVNELLSNPHNFYMLSESNGVKPLTWVQREAARFVQRIADTDPVVFDEHKKLFGGWGRGIPAPGFPWLSSRSGP